MTEETVTVIKTGPTWTNDHMFATYEEATTRLEKLTTKWTDDKQENMQTKVRLRANGMFLVKYRKDPAFQKEKKKNGSGNGKNKNNTKKGKTDTGTSV
tara:strand:- start:1528 stop:1821 length:294 start_codon:yes stop_codon:yes gene_type:complete